MFEKGPSIIVSSIRYPIQGNIIQFDPNFGYGFLRLFYLRLRFMSVYSLEVGIQILAFQVAKP